MMFHKQYYKLEEAAQKLGIDVDVLINIHCQDECQLCILFQTPKHALSFDLINGKEKELSGVFSNKPYPIVYGEIEGAQIAIELKQGLQVNCPLVYDLDDNNNTPDFLEMTRGDYPAYPVSFDESLFDDDNYVSYWDWALSVIESEIYLTDIVITRAELTRLLALKAQHDGKPTLEQVQAENEALKQQLEALTNSTTKGKQQQREQALSYWIAGKGLDTVKRMKQADIHEELKHANGLFQIAESTFEDFWQEQKLIELDAGKR
jgi:hypothetical protein